MNRSERLNQELIFLSYRQEFHIKELMQEFNISKRTALRDVNSLEQLGLSIYVEPGRYGGYQIMQQQLWVPILLNSQEINALFLRSKHSVYCRRPPLKSPTIQFTKNSWQHYL
nr:HTH domain-containing protein [Lactiplantibacillus plantarum]